MTDWTGRQLTILGLSKSGAAVARYVHKRGGQCLISEYQDAKPEQQELIRELEALGVDIETGGHSDACLTFADQVIISPGIAPHTQIVQKIREAGLTLISEVEFAYRESQTLTKQPRWIGITGTNGKTTTTTLISKILTDAGYNAPACGNIGLPITEIIDTHAPEFIVAELSSFQLAFSDTLTAELAVFLNLTPDHVDWHGTLDAYRDAKVTLFVGNRSPKYVITKGDDVVSQTIKANTTAKTVGFSIHQADTTGFNHQAYVDSHGDLMLSIAPDKPALRLMHRNELTILGNHNIENVLASASIALLAGVPVESIAETCLTFSGVEHRLEYVTTLDGIAFYNDSKATNPESSISALQAFAPNQVILIAGGKDKMTSLVEWVDVVRRYAAHVVLFGQAAQRFEDVLRADGFIPVERADSLQDAVNRARTASANRPSPLPVLFSPACASFDMFQNFEDRGRQFKYAVQKLSQGTLQPTSP